MSFYPNMTLTVVPIAKDETFELYGYEDVALENQVHIRLENAGKTLSNLRCNPAEAIAYAQRIMDAAQAFDESED